MSIKYMAFDSHEVTGPDGEIGYDRALAAADHAEYYGDLVSNGVIVPQGGALGNQLKIEIVTGLRVKVNEGRAWINGYRVKVYDGGEFITLNEAHPTLARIDRIVLELNLNDNARSITIKVLKGTPAANPQITGLVRTETVHQLALAHMMIPANAATIAWISDERSRDVECGIANVNIGIKVPDGNSAANVFLTPNTASQYALSGVNANVDKALDKLVGAVPKNKVVTITSSGTWTPPKTPMYVDVFMIGGGGGGATGGGWNTSIGGGGGGGGISKIVKSLLVTGPVAVLIGNGGAGGAALASNGGNGGSTHFGEFGIGGGGGGLKPYKSTYSERGTGGAGSGGGGAGGGGASQNNGYEGGSGHGMHGQGPSRSSEMAHGGIGGLGDGGYCPFNKTLYGGGGGGGSYYGSGGMGGAGGGGRGGDTNRDGSDATNYGGGGGGGGSQNEYDAPNGVGGAGMQGIIVIAYAE